METHDRPESIEELPTAPPPRPASRPSALIGAVLGMTALAGSIVGISAVAGAQDEPTPESTTESTEGDTVVATAPMGLDEDFKAFEECMAEQLGDLWVEPEITPGEIEPGDVEALPFEPGDEQAFRDADQACRDLLPEPMQLDMAAWEAFDDCLKDAGVFGEALGDTSAVHIATGDSFQIVEFGSTEGSVTISGTDGDLSVTASGGATVIDHDALDAQFAEFEEAHSACEDLLPEGVAGMETVTSGVIMPAAPVEGDLDR